MSLRKIIFSMIVRLPKYNCNRFYSYLIGLNLGAYDYIGTFNFKHKSSRNIKNFTTGDLH